MQKQTKFSHSIQAAQISTGRQSFHKFLGTAVLLVVVLIASACVAAQTVPENEANNAEVITDQRDVAAEDIANDLPEHEAIEVVRHRNYTDSQQVQAEAVATGNTGSQPAFDREALRQTFFDDWTIEADAVDVSLIKPGPEGNVTTGPVTFDAEVVREYQATEWVVEADAVDVSLIEPHVNAEPAAEQITAEAWLETVRRNYEDQPAASVEREPVTFDAEALRETFFNDWVVEAEAIDVNTLEQPVQGNVSAQPASFDKETLRQTFFADWVIESEAVDVRTIEQSSSIRAANPELAVAQRYTR